jgi:hypothetical protein
MASRVATRASSPRTGERDGARPPVVEGIRVLWDRDLADLDIGEAGVAEELLHVRRVAQ